MNVTEPHAPCSVLGEEDLASYVQENNILTLVWRSLQVLSQKINIYPTEC